MLYIQPFTFNPFQENTYLIINDKKQCWIVDPGMYDSTETNHLLNYIEERGLQPQAIINTHAHIDHILGINALKDKFNIQFGLHEKDMPVLNNALQSAAMFGFNLGKAPTADFFIKEGEPLKLGDDELEVRFAPGHSPGSIVFYSKEGKWLIGGDVLFNGSIGRTDLPGGNFDTLINSIRTQLFTLPEETLVLSGHGPSTTIGKEQTSNPFLT
ncbi:MAG: MBL fold metallo-hydrolase [Sphingobacteriales bacterium]|nr:MAG: MBL fold metallo-hydrolase [Sphingobacteriales bacterium]